MPCDAMKRSILVAVSVCAALASVSFAMEDDSDTHDHPYCMYDEVMAMERNGMSMEAALASSKYRAATTIEIPRSRATSAPHYGFGPLRIGIYTQDLYDSNKYCNFTLEPRSDFLGGIATCMKDDILTLQKRDLLVKSILPAVVKMHQERLQVDLISHISLPNMTGRACGSFAIPQWMRDRGLSNADFILFVAAAPSRGRSSLWAATCGYDLDGRPLVGVLNVGPKFIDDTDLAVRLVAHEVLHVLGFDKDLFAKQKMIKTVRCLRGVPSTSVVASPNVVTRAGNYFNCDVFPGMELSTYEYTDAPGSHWSRRNARDDLMFAVQGTFMRYSAITMAAMQDLGFYRVSYAKAEHMSWGFKAGCGLLNDKCVANGVTAFPNMFCANETGADEPWVCNAERTALGRCVIRRHSSALPPHFQYFSDPYLGGLQDMDFCPMVTSTSETSCLDGVSHVMSGSIVGKYSRCVDVPPGSNFKHAICVELSCLRDRQQYAVRFYHGLLPVLCPEGEEVDASVSSTSFPKGSTIVCPPYSSLCGNTFNSVSVSVTLDTSPRTCDPNGPGYPGYPGDPWNTGNSGNPGNPGGPSNTGNPGSPGNPWNTGRPGVPGNPGGTGNTGDGSALGTGLWAAAAVLSATAMLLVT